MRRQTTLTNMDFQVYIMRGKTISLLGTTTLLHSVDHQTKQLSPSTSQESNKIYKMFLSPTNLLSHSFYPCYGASLSGVAKSLARSDTVMDTQALSTTH